MIKLSFIVPVYNVAPYVRMCVASLLSQDYKDYEIILVDDGSTDNSGAICDEYVSLFSETRSSHNPLTPSPVISVIHQSNAGLSAARNAGIAAAKGEYICFVDSDDYWQHNVLAGLMEQVERDNLDVLRFRFQYVTPEGESYNPYKSDPFRGMDYSDVPTDGVSFLNSRMNTRCYAWQFILRRDLIYTLHNTPYTVNSGVLYTPGIYFEDTDWTPRMLRNAHRVASTNTLVYNYLVREGSITNAVNRSKQKKVLDDKMHLITTLQQQAIDLRKSGRYNRWYNDMIAATVVSIIEMLGTTFYAEKDAYLEQLIQLNVFPIAAYNLKSRLINISPMMVIKMIHFKRS